MDLEALAALGGEGEVLPEIVVLEADASQIEDELVRVSAALEEFFGSVASADLSIDDMDGFDVPLGEWAEVGGE